MSLVDTSVWVDHLRKGDGRLVELLKRGDVVMHPFVVGEIACGNLAHRTLTLDLLEQLPRAVVADTDEVLGYIDRHNLHGKGIGYVDVHVLTSAALGDTKLWTRDKRLRAVAGSLGCALAAAGGH